MIEKENTLSSIPGPQILYFYEYMNYLIQYMVSKTLSNVLSSKFEFEN